MAVAAALVIVDQQGHEAHRREQKHEEAVGPGPDAAGAWFESTARPCGVILPWADSCPPPRDGETEGWATVLIGDGAQGVPAPAMSLVHPVLAGALVLVAGGCPHVLVKG